MTEKVDQEIEAIKTILNILEPLEEGVKNNILEYVIKRMNIQLDQIFPLAINKQNDDIIPRLSENPEVEIHLAKFKAQKNPKSANEMAAVVAYWLQHLAPTAERKINVTLSDMETYFHIGDYPLPERIEYLLSNAKTAGYFDSVEAGVFKLNAIGHNLVKHSLPRSSSATAVAGHKRKSKVKHSSRK